MSSTFFFYRRSNTRLSAVIVGILCCSLLSCEKITERIAGFYPIDSLVNAQIKLLAFSKASLHKTVNMAGKEDGVTVAPIDSNAWSYELDIFRELKVMNKPINIEAYKVENGLTDSKSNLKIKSIVTNQLLPVRSMKIFYQGTEERVRKIVAQFNEVNSLYSSSRLLTMEFTEVQNKPVLSSYSIEGGQKMFLSDSVAYTIKGFVSIP